MSTLGFVNVASWVPDQVVAWLKGLDIISAEYLDCFTERLVSGLHLLQMTNYDIKQLNIVKLGHQERLLHSIGLLQSLQYELASQTQLSIALQLSSIAKNLYNELKSRNHVTKSYVILEPHLQQQQQQLHSKQATDVLTGVSNIVDCSKLFIQWIDWMSHVKVDRLAEMRVELIRHNLHLVHLAREESQNRLDIMKTCQQIVDLCDGLLQDSKDPLVITPASLELVSVHKKPDDELGVSFTSSFKGVHKIDQVKAGSAAEACGRITAGDEIIQVNYKTVVGWETAKLVGAMKENANGITLTLKKCPHHISVMGFNKNKMAGRGVGGAVKQFKGAGFGMITKDKRKSQLRHSPLINTVPERDFDDGNVSDGDVFQGETMDRPDFIDADLKMRRATVTGASPPSMKRSSLSDLTDLPSDASFTSHVRPKSYFPGFIHDTVAPLQKSSELENIFHHEETTLTRKPFDVRISSARKERKVMIRPDPSSSLTIPSSTSSTIPSDASSTSSSSVMYESLRTDIPSVTSTAPDDSTSKFSSLSPKFTTKPPALAPIKKPVTLSTDESTDKTPSVSSPDSPLYVFPKTSAKSPRDAASVSSVASFSPFSKHSTDESLSSLPDASPRFNFPLTVHKENKELLSPRVAHFRTGSADLIGASPWGRHPSYGDLGTPLLRGTSELGDVTESMSPRLLRVLRIDSKKRAENTQQERRETANSLQESDKQSFVTRIIGGVPHSHKLSAKVADPVISPSLSTTSLSSNKKGLARKGVSRRISCKDLGSGDCQGWLWKKKDGAGLRPGKWVKCWFVLHHKNLFYFKDPEDLKAQGVLHLPGFTVSPTQESRSKKFAFKAYNMATTFVFAAERQDDMAKWMNKMGLASLGDFDLETTHVKTTAGFNKPSHGIDPMPYFSESDEDFISSPNSTSDSPSISRNSSREDLTDLYRHIVQADLDIAGVNKRIRRSTLLAGASFNVKPTSLACTAEREALCKLLCLKRTLKDKEQNLTVINDLLSRQPITAESLAEFKENHGLILDV